MRPTARHRGPRAGVLFGLARLAHPLEADSAQLFLSLQTHRIKNGSKAEDQTSLGSYDQRLQRHQFAGDRIVRIFGPE
jgi:hypothetical protein